jgi:ATP-dependent DNA helicase 2 subunit 1
MDFDENLEDTGENTGEMNINSEDLMLVEDDANAQYRSMKDCVIFLVDCGKSLIESNAMNNIFAVAESFLKTKIITNEKDVFGLICYNYHVEKKNQLNFYGIDVRIPLAPPDAQLIKSIKILQQNTNPQINKNYNNFLRTEFPKSKEEIALSNALWICHSEFKNFDPKKFNRRIFLFTDNDNPMNSNLTERNITIQRARDMLESEIVIELFPMNMKNNFDMKKFFSEIITVGVDTNEDLILNIENCENRIRELTKRIRQKEVKKRTLGRCPLFLTKDVKFTVNFYATLKKTTKSISHNVDARTNKPLNTINQAICKETGSILYQNQIGTFQAYGDRKVNFTKDEMKQIKTLDSPGIKLMGFKSFNSIKPYYNIRESYFIYPDEYLSNGASQLCDALIKQLIAKNKVAIVKFVPRDGANIRFCALIPQKESFDEDYFQTPPGFNLVFLPYADEIRSNCDILNKIKNYDDIKDKINSEKLQAVKRLIKKMNIDFDCRNFENPTIQKFYATLQALALSEGDVEKVEDLINPDTPSLERVLNNTDEDVKNLFYGYHSSRTFIPQMSAKKTTRKRKGDDEEILDKVSSEMDHDTKSNLKGAKRYKKSNTNSMIVDEEFTQGDKNSEKSVTSDDQSMKDFKNLKNNINNIIHSYDEHDNDRESSNISITDNTHNSRKNNPNRKKYNRDDNTVMEDIDQEDDDDSNNHRNNFSNNNIDSNCSLLKKYENGELQKFSVKRLRDICASKNVRVSSKSNKAEIINKLTDFLFQQIK